MRKAHLLAAALSCAAPVTGAYAQSQPPVVSPPDAPANDELLVEGRRMPTAEAPRSSTCVALVVSDMTFREGVNTAKELGTMSPAVYLPTRAPRSPDYSAGATVPVGSPLPVIEVRTRFGVGRDGKGTAAVDTAATLSAGGMTSLDKAKDACVTMHLRTATSNQADIAQLDRTLPMAFALFDQGRYAESLEWFQRAQNKLPLELGGDEAALFLGKLYLAGFGEPVDRKKGVAWLKRVASAPFNPTLQTPIFDPATPDWNTAIGEAAVMLGNLYRVGYRDVARDPAEARRWYERAFDVGHVAAARTLGDFYRDGVGVSVDARKAADYYRKAATLDLPAAQVALADLLRTGAPGVRPDRRQALARYQAAAKHQHPGALYALGRAFELGEGVGADPALALGFYKSAVLKGSVAAKTALDGYFQDGRFVTRDETIARKWFEQAAVEGNAEGMYRLATMMRTGSGGPTDVAGARRWLQAAAARGHGQAMAALAMVAE